VACVKDVEVAGHPVSAWGFESVRGTIGPAIVAGRAPLGAREVALGSVTLDAVRGRIGKSVRIQGETGSGEYRIVGRVVLPTLNTESLQPLADGASLTVAGLRRLVGTGAYETHFLLVNARSGDRAALEQRMRSIPGSKNTGVPATPVEVDRLRQINWFPAILALLLATLALVAVGHSLVTSVRRRRSELALLKTIGFGRRQIGATVAWQATTVGVVGLVVGIPVGILLGRAVWSQVADGLGVATVVAVPVLSVVATIAAVLVLLNLLAFFPARTAARTRPAVALRSE
jgi:hypothetical protein